MDTRWEGRFALSYPMLVSRRVGPDGRTLIYYTSRSSFVKIGCGGWDLGAGGGMRPVARDLQPHTAAADTEAPPAC